MRPRPPKEGSREALFNELKAQINDPQYANRPELKRIINSWEVDAFRSRYQLPISKQPIPDSEISRLKGIFSTLLNIDSNREEIENAMETFGIGAQHVVHSPALHALDEVISEWLIPSDNINAILNENNHIKEVADEAAANEAAANEAAEACFNELLKHELITATELRNLVAGNKVQVKGYFLRNPGVVIEDEVQALSNNKEQLGQTLTQLGINLTDGDDEAEAKLNELFGDIQYQGNEFLRNASTVKEILDEPANIEKLKQRLGVENTQIACQTLLNAMWATDSINEIRDNVIQLFGQPDELRDYIEPIDNAQKENITNITNAIFAEKQYRRVIADTAILPNDSLLKMLLLERDSVARNALKRHFATLPTDHGSAVYDTIIEELKNPNTTKERISAVLGAEAANAIFTEVQYRRIKDDLLAPLKATHPLKQQFENEELKPSIKAKLQGKETAQEVDQLLLDVIDDKKDKADIQNAMDALGLDIGDDHVKDIFADNQFRKIKDNSTTFEDTHPLRQQFESEELESSIKAKLREQSTVQEVNQLIFDVADDKKDKADIQNAMDALGLDTSDDKVADLFANYQFDRIKENAVLENLLQTATPEQKALVKDELKQKESVTEIDKLVQNILKANTVAALTPALAALGITHLDDTSKANLLEGNKRYIKAINDRFESYKFLINRYLAESKIHEDPRDIIIQENIKRIDKMQSDLLLYKTTLEARGELTGTIQQYLNKINQIHANMAAKGRIAYFGDKAYAVKAADDPAGNLETVIKNKIDTFFGERAIDPATGLTSDIASNILTSRLKSDEKEWEVRTEAKPEENEALVTCMTLHLSKEGEANKRVDKIAYIERHIENPRDYTMEIQAKSESATVSRKTKTLRWLTGHNAPPLDAKLLEGYFLVSFQAYSRMDPEDKKSGFALERNPGHPSLSKEHLEALAICSMIITGQQLNNLSGQRIKPVSDDRVEKARRALLAIPGLTEEQKALIQRQEVVRDHVKKVDSSSSPSLKR